MKKKFQQLLASCIFFMFSSVHAQAPLTIIKGHTDMEKITSVTLWQVIEGEKSEFGTARLNAGNNFAFALPEHKEGYYYISDQYKRKFHRIYLKSGDQLELKIGLTGFTVLKGSPENKLLQQWNDMYEVVAKSAFMPPDTSTYISFFPRLNTLLTQATTFKQKINTSNKKFNWLLKWSVDFDVENAALSFLLIPHTKHPKREEYPAYYNTVIQAKKFCDATMLQTGDAASTLSRYGTFTYLMNPDKAKAGTGINIVDQICNDTLKGLYIANSLGRYKSYDDLLAGVEPYRKYLITDTMQARLFRAMKGLNNLKKGNPSYQFSFPDNNGKSVTMASLKRKVVLIDVWATWCGPCKAEIPALKKLETEMHDLPVAFVSISVDEEQDRGKWKQFIKTENLGGVQLFATGWSDITKYYDIKGIPRFMVFDQEGKIVTVDAPRPSSPELKKLLINVLENNNKSSGNSLK